MEIYVMFKVNRRTGEIEQTITAMGMALLKMHALQNAKPTKQYFIFERESGKLIFVAQGVKNGFPKVKSVKQDGDLGTCEDFGISLEDLHAIKDERFDKEA